MPKCDMIVDHTVNTEGDAVGDIECNLPAAYQTLSGDMHCCQNCYQQLEPDIQKEYVPIKEDLSMSPERVKELLLRRRSSLRLLAQYRKQIERIASPDAPGSLSPTLPRHVLGMIGCYLAADFIVWLDSDIKGIERLPGGAVETTDEKRQLFAIEVYCDPSDDARDRLAQDLNTVIRTAIDTSADDVTVRDAGHFNLLHRVAGVIENP